MKKTFFEKKKKTVGQNILGFGVWRLDFGIGTWDQIPNPNSTDMSFLSPKPQTYKFSDRPDFPLIDSR